MMQAPLTPSLGDLIVACDFFTFIMYSNRLSCRLCSQQLNKCVEAMVSQQAHGSIHDDEYESEMYKV